MDATQLVRICQQVARQFPETRGCRPRIQPQTNGTTLIFQVKAITANGKALPRIIRVNVSPAGKIIKMTTSH
ncbi:MAG TPA: hypothetical protein PKG95_00305 [Anaerolineaceae bacterium]|jgi:hypothetical protein|nr:hypothetical protein [Anaerolineaceae bacterium]